MGRKAKGNLLIIGGAEDKKHNCTILTKFVELAGKGNIVVLTSATDQPEKAGETYYNLFKDLGARDVEVLDISDRKTANAKATLDSLRKATGIFFTGGDQLKITGTLGGTEVDSILHILYEQGVIIGGTSAGASVMSSTMIVGGENDETPQKAAISMAPGMALVEEVVIDQHFAQRGRIGRLLAVIAQNPHYLGIGIDEDTAILVNDSDCFEVVGSQTVTVVDGQRISFTNASETGARHALALGNVILHVLPAGYRFDLRTRQPITGNSIK
ncbi:MAG TPA: cyanophycinase [Desulfobacteria bacterium]|nr:cyanophycinase [Desulfobacteria bacterium]